MKYLIYLFILTMLSPALALAHPGHAAVGSAAHELVHMAWILAAVTVGVLTLLRRISDRRSLP